MRACQLKKEVYEPKKMEAVYQNIVARSKTENPQFYEVRVDDFPVVEKTSDPERFMNYAEFVDANTKYISVFLYYSSKNASDKLFFFLQPNQIEQSSGLNGFSRNENPTEHENELKEKLRKDLHYEQLLAENEELKEEIAELERTIELIEEEKDGIKNNRDITANNIFGYLVNGALSSKVVKDAFPIFDNLSGTPKDNPQTNQETQNSFRPKNTPKEETEDVESEEVESPKLTDDEKIMVATLLDIEHRVGRIDLRNVFHLIDMVTLNPQTIHFAIKQVSNYLKQKPVVKTPESSTDNSNETEPAF